MANERHVLPDPLIAKLTFVARTIAIDHYKKTSAIVNRVPEPGTPMVEQLKKELSSFPYPMS